MITRNAPLHKKRRYHRLYMRKWRKLNPTVGAEYMRKKRKNKKVEMLRYERFLYRKNRKKALEKNKIYRQKNKEYFATSARNRRLKSIENGGSHTKEDVFFILKNQKYECIYCRKNIKEKYHIDHKTPIIRGGKNHRRNLQALCPPCNLKKNKMTHREFLREVSYAS